MVNEKAEVILARKRVAMKREMRKRGLKVDNNISTETLESWYNAIINLNEKTNGKN